MNLRIFIIIGLTLNSPDQASAQSYVPEWKNNKIKVQPSINIKAYAFNLKDVRLLNSPFKEAMERDAAYMLTLEPDRFLHRFRENAGLKPKGELYGGWESKGVSGFTLGHYISALAMQYAATGDKRFKERTDYIIDELALCQQRRKTGYVGGIPEEDRIWKEVAAGDIRTQGFDLNGGWVPLYTVHKLMAGLADAYLHTDNEKAKTVVTKMADWAYDLTKSLSKEQMEKLMFCEHGGMNDVLANIYAITGNKKYLDLSYRFNHHQVLDPLARKEDQLKGKHANTQIPKVIGSAVQYQLTGDQQNETIAEFFWQTVTDNHSYVIGGNSDFEHFGEPGKLSDRLSTNTTETCNTYNMLKLTRHFFSWNPSSRFNDYYERALYNHILASQNPENGMMCYYVPLKMGAQKIFNTPFESFWCCTGTGMENHVKYGENIYAMGQDGSLYVNLFIPSELNWKDKGVTIRQETNYPKSDTVRLMIGSAKKVTFPIRIRKPGWAKQGMQVRVNNNPVAVQPGDDGYIVLNRKWNTSDVIEIIMPMSLYTEAMPDNLNRLAILYGPLVLAGKLGDKAPDPVTGTPVLITGKKKLLAGLHPVLNQPLVFKTYGIAKPADVTLVPFYQVYDQFYNVYWDLFTQQEWTDKQAEYEAEKKRLLEIEAKTIDVIRIGEQQPEVDHNLQGEKTESGELGENKWRHAAEGGWFSYDMKTGGNEDLQLICTYWGSDGGNREFNILINGQKIANQKLNNQKPNQFYNVAYDIPAQLIEGKDKITVKFESVPGNIVGGVFGCRIIKK